MRLASGGSLTITPEGQAVSTVRLQPLDKKASACWVEVTYPHGWDGQAVSINYSALNPHGFHSKPDVIGGIGTQPTHTDTPIRWNTDGSVTATRQASKPDAGASALITLAGIPQATADSVAACGSQNNPQSQDYGDCVTLVASIASEASQSLASQVTAPASAPYTCQVMLGTPLQQVVTGWSDTLSTVPTMVGYGQAQEAASELQTGASNMTLGFQAIAKDCGVQTDQGASASASVSDANGGQASTSGDSAPSGAVYDVQTVVSAHDGTTTLSEPPSTLSLSGDGTGRIKSLHWTNWGGPTAEGTGVLGTDNCIPGCAQGSFTWTPTTITLSGIGQCFGHDAYLTVQVRGLNGGRPEPLDFSNECQPSANSDTSTAPSGAQPSTAIHFMSVDDRERCTAYPLGGIAVYCVAAPSGLAVWLAAGGKVHYQGKTSSIPAAAGKPWSEGTARTFWNAIRCDSSWHGIRCTDLEGGGQSFVLGDSELIVDTPTGERTYH